MRPHAGLPLRTRGIDGPTQDAMGASMLSMMQELYPICRSITGSGVRESLALVNRSLGLACTEVPTGTRVHDWTVPREWEIREAYVEHESGRRFADFSQCNLHVVAYSEPVDCVMPLSELLPRIHSLPDHPEWIPFRSSYYTQDWGFCMDDRSRRDLPAGNYRAVIRSRLFDGSLTFAEHVHAGRTSDEVLLFAHTCHPSLCNDNLSGIVVATHVAKYLATLDTRYSYRLVLAPATIGSIAWTALRSNVLAHVKHGLVLAMLGDEAPLEYHCTRRRDDTINRAAAMGLKPSVPAGKVVDFSPWGFDERQFNAPGFKLPVGRLSRASPGNFPQEHTSADNLALMSTDSLVQSWLACLRIIEVLEHDQHYINLQPYGEPQLGRRGLYRQTGGHYDAVPERHMAFLWLLNQSDGQASLLDIAERSGLDFGLIADSAVALREAGLLGVPDPASLAIHRTT